MTRLDKLRRERVFDKTIVIDIYNENTTTAITAIINYFLPHNVWVVTVSVTGALTWSYKLRAEKGRKSIHFG